MAIETYGRELLGYLVAVTGDPVEGEEVFAETCARLWAGLERFAWRSRFRTWAYAIARNTLSEAREANRRRPQSPSEPPWSRLADRIRTETRPWLKTEARSGLAKLRAQLAPEERALLILRVDRGLSWPELAVALSDPDAPPSPEEARRQVVRLRKRFERLKTRLRALARTEGVPGFGSS